VAGPPAKHASATATALAARMRTLALALFMIFLLCSRAHGGSHAAAAPDRCRTWPAADGSLVFRPDQLAHEELARCAMELRRRDRVPDVRQHEKFVRLAGRFERPGQG